MKKLLKILLGDLKEFVKFISLVVSWLSLGSIVMYFLINYFSVKNPAITLICLIFSSFISLGFIIWVNSVIDRLKE